ncbi:MAG TPA: YcxB family protein [Vicinamibacterales bacterium]
MPLVIVGGWFVLDRWGLSYFSAQTYEREHAVCIPNDQIRVLDADGITAQCTISSSSVHWAGISRVGETEEFFLFFTTPGCAIQLPKRAIDNLERFRAWLSDASQRKELANNRRLQPSSAVRS